MTGICIYAPGCEDFTANGLGPLTPLECVIEEQAGGMYELTLTHPIDDSLRWTLLAPGCIIRAPAPVRESPLYEAPATDEPVTVTRQVWVVAGTTHGLYIRTGPGMNYRRIGVKRNGVEVLELEDAPDPWKKVCVLGSGQVGYMSTKYLSPLRTVTEVIEPAKPAPGGILKIGQSRDQLFRIYSVEQDSAAATVTAKALHVFYDEADNLIGECEVSGDVNAAIAAMKAKLVLPPQVQLHALNLSGDIQGDYSNQSPVEALLNPDTGIVPRTRAMLVRDNWDAYLLPDMVRDRGVTIRRGKNLIGAEITTDASGIATRIIPVGKNRNGDPLYLPGDGWVESPRADLHPFPRIRRIEYDVQTGENGLTGDEAVRSELRRLAEAEFSEKGADLPAYGMDVDFILLGSTDEYAGYASLQAVHLYDTVTIIDELLGLTAKVRVRGYKWNCLTGQYEGVTLGEIQNAQQLQSYNLPDGGISGTKIMSNTLGGSALRNASIQYAKIAVAAVEQLNAASLTALTARIQELVAGSMTADELYAGIADITKAAIREADIDWASVSELNAAIAAIAQAKINTADIDFARIKDMVTGTAIITEGVGGQLFISRLAVTEANMVSLTTGELVVKGGDGHFYSLSVDADGKVVAALKQLNNDDVQDLSINAGEKLIGGSVTAACLNATEIFADNAVIRQLIAANLDVDTLFAREAFLNLLRTGKIVGDKSITMIANEASDAKRLSNIEVIEGTFVQTDRREGEGIRIFSEIAPKQDLAHGNPYPAGAGKNFLYPTTPLSYSLQTFEFDAHTGTLSITKESDAGKDNQLYFELDIDASKLVGKKVTLSYGSYSITTAGDSQRIYLMDQNDKQITNIWPNSDSYTSRTAVVPDGTAKFRILIRIDQNSSLPIGTKLTISGLQLEASDSFTGFEPASNICPIKGWTELNANVCGKTYTLNFDETIYGGSVDWAAGEMTVRYGFVELTGNETIGIYENATLGNGATIYNVLPVDEYRAAGISSHAIVHKYLDTIGVIVLGNNSRHIYWMSILTKLGFDTVDQFKAWLAAQRAAGTPVQIAYMLANPYTIKLTPSMIASLNGINTVYTDADDGRVEFGHELPDICDSILPPASPEAGAFWLDRSVTPCVLRRYTGSDWETVNDVTTIESVQDALLNKQAALEAEQRKTALYLKLDDTLKAVRIGQSGVTSEFRIDAFGSGVVVNDEIFSRFEANRALFGNMEIRKPAVGGLAFDSIN